MGKYVFRSLFLVAVVVCPSSMAAAAQREQISLKSLDGLEISADLYLAHEPGEGDTATPFIVLFHQAGWSRGEYREIAPRLNRLGFNCMAIDQRSGGTVNEVSNETAARAKQQGQDTAYVDAEQDLVAALEYARKHYARGKLIAWGSSYSSALVLRVAGEHPDLADGVLSFSPGEYFGRLGRPGDWIQRSAKKIRCPVFITSASKESANWKPIFDAIPGQRKSSYRPDTPGNHGSRALWKRFDDSPGYWKAVEAFLAEQFPGTRESFSAPQRGS